MQCVAPPSKALHPPAMSTHTSSTISAQYRRTRSVIRVLFGIYLFLFLYGPGSDILALAHWYIAHGVTSYNPLAGALVLTGLALWLASFIARHTHYRPTHCVQAFVLPSALCVAAPGLLIPAQRSLALVCTLLAIVLWLLCLRPFSDTTRRSPGNQVSATWNVTPYVHLFILFAYIGIAGVLPSSIVYEQRLTQALVHGEDAERFEDAGMNAPISTPTLTSLRAYALAQTPEGMGSQFFTYSLGDGGATQLLLRDTCGPHRKALHDTILHDLGLDSIVAPPSQVADRLRLAAERQPQGMARDYYLCALLLERDLERFAHELPRYYVVSDSTRLPAHYAEALVLYDRTHPQPEPIYPEASITADYRDFREMMTQNRHTSPGLIWEKYHNKYWWYYYRPILISQPETKP